MWYNEAVIYQIYPLGLCGAPAENDSVQSHRILRLLDWVEHIKALGADTVLLNPLFQSDRHGYDTRDFFTPDCRLGTEEDLKRVCDAFHASGIRVLFDGVFNHVGRGFWAFEELRRSADRPFRDWFYIRDGNSPYNDGFDYEGWEGHKELVKLNLRSAPVREHIFSALRYWTERFGIDGLRLDVAYCLDRDFLRELRSFTSSLKEDFLLIGEVIHGDYREIMNGSMCHSATNYECYKGLWSSFNSLNMFEIAHSLQRQFGPEPWCLYTGQQLLSFLDNHDVDRIASRLSDRAQLKPAYALLFGMPGTPCLYYGSEWGIEGRKDRGDAQLRPELKSPVFNELSLFISRLASARRQSPALCRGGIRNLLLTNRQFIFSRELEGERVIVAINADSSPFTARFDPGCGRATDLISGREQDFSSAPELPPHSAFFWRPE